MTNYRDNVKKDKNLTNYSECKKLIENHDMSSIGKGGQADIFKVVSDKCGSVVLKLFREDVIKKLQVNEIYNLEEKMKAEYQIMTRIKILIDYKYCANFINIIDFNPKQKYIIIEYADGDCTDIIKNEFDYDILCSFMCQILIGLLCFQKIINMWHNDFKLENILYKKINEKIILHYVINNQHFYIPTYGYLFMIADYGMCIDKTFVDKNVRNVYSDFTDTERLKNSFEVTLRKLNKKNDNIQKLIKILGHKISILDILKNNFSHFTKNNNYDSDYVETFVFNFL
jgi:serine/threonine protein kinase